MRNFTNTLLFESALDSVPSSNQPLYSILDRLLNPLVKVVEDDCGTELGVLAALADRTEGAIELATDLPVTKAALIAASNSGQSSISIRTLNSCISKGGVCTKCLLASRPRLTGVTTGSLFKLTPELTISTESLSFVTGSTTATLSHTASEYDSVYVFDDGALLPTNTYTISGSTFTLSSAATSDKTLLFKYQINSNIAYFYWLTHTYSSSLLGVKSLFNLPLPVKPSLLRNAVVQEDIDILYRSLLSSDAGSEDFVTYIPSIKDPLEKAIYVILMCSIFLNS